MLWPYPVSGLGSGIASGREIGHGRWHFISVVSQEFFIKSRKTVKNGAGVGEKKITHENTTHPFQTTDEVYIRLFDERMAGIVAILF